MKFGIENGGSQTCQGLKIKAKDSFVFKHMVDANKAAENLINVIFTSLQSFFC